MVHTLVLGGMIILYCIVLLMTLHYGNVTLLTLVSMQRRHIETVYS